MNKFYVLDFKVFDNDYYAVKGELSEGIFDLFVDGVSLKNKDISIVLKRELEAGGDLDKIIYNRQSTYELRRGMGAIPKDFQAHHIIPRELRDKFKDFFKKIGFDIEDGAKNGIAIPPNKTVLEASKQTDEFVNYAFHQGSHPDYTRRIRNMLEDVQKLFNSGVINEAEALKELYSIISKAKNVIQNGKGLTINQLTNF